MNKKHNVNADGQTHDQLQAACWKAAQRLYHPFLTQRLYCIPNDMHAGNVARWKQYEALGVTPGVWDMCLNWLTCLGDWDDNEWPRPIIIPAVHWFEFKVGSDQLSKAQDKFQARMMLIGHKFHIITREHEFQQALKLIIEPTLHIAKQIWKEEYEQNGENRAKIGR
jgi:hypothetical protein